MTPKEQVDQFIANQPRNLSVDELADRIYQFIKDRGFVVVCNLPRKAA